MKNRNKAATAATAVVLSAALLMTGTFAWNDFSQKKLNELAGVLNYDVALVEDFEETSDWSFANPDVNKDVSAANKGDNAAYVRINLREYLQVRPFTYTNDSYVKDAEGNPVRFAVDKNGEYIPSTAADPKAFGVDFSGDIGVKYFVVAQGADQTIATMDSTNENGQIGKFMINPALPDGGKVYDADKVEHYGAAKKAATTDEEMAYAIHKFTDTPDPWQTKVEEYVSWKMGPAVKTMAEYKALSADEKKDAKFWIVDTDGWCYWSQPLAKDEQTTLLLDAATLKKAPKGDLYYAIHSTMQAVDKENLGYWATDASDDAKDAILPDLNDGETVKPKILATGVSLDQTALQLNDANPVKLTATVEPAEAEQDVKWTSSNTSVATVDKDGNVTATGQGTATITATTKDGSNKTETCSVNVPTWITVTGLTLNKNTLNFNGLESEQLIAAVSPSNATNKKVKWNSSNPSVAMVDSSGLVTGVGVGTATITATTLDGTYTDNCSVSITQVAATSISIQRDVVYIGVNDEARSFPAKVGPVNTTDKAYYTSSDESIITVDSATGLMTAVGSVGQKAEISVTAGTASAKKISVTIVNQTIQMGTYPDTDVPMNWIVLEKTDNSALVFLDGYFDKRIFHSSTPNPGWKNSEMRTYLNGNDSSDFIPSVFSVDEQARILSTELRTASSYDSTDTYTTTDRVFLLAYGGKATTENYNFPDYSYCTTSTNDPIIGNSFWSRSPFFTAEKEKCSSGSIEVTSRALLRPAMWVTLP